MHSGICHEKTSSHPGMGRFKDWILNWWKDKASRRYLKLYEENKISHTNYWFKNIKKEEVDQYLSTTGVLI